MRTRYLIAAIVIGALGMMSGCGDDDGGGPGPVTGVTITPGQANVEIGHHLELEATVSGGDSKALDWYVNGIPEGDAVVGTISLNSPATYTAPDSVPSSPTVVVKAVSVEDTTMMDSCSVSIGFTKIFVDAGQGDNDTGTGCINLPVKTITRGLDMAEKGMTVLVQPGVYDRANGELFEMAVRDSISLVGMDWETCVIRGHALGGSFNKVFWINGRHPVLRKFTLEMDEPGEDPCEVAVYIQATDGLIDSLRFNERADYSLIRFVNSTDMVVQNCQMVMDDDDREDRAFEVINENFGAVVRNCTMSGFAQAMNISGLNDMMIESCTIMGSDSGIYMGTGTATNNPNPDLGGGARGSIGGNTFTGYTNYALYNQTSNMIYARFNIWDNDPPQEDVDYINSGEGSIILD
jgi:hypothetical protein